MKFDKKKVVTPLDLKGVHLGYQGLHSWENFCDAYKFLSTGKPAGIKL